MWRKNVRCGDFVSFIDVMVRREVCVWKIVGWVKDIVGKLSGRSRKIKECGWDESGVFELLSKRIFDWMFFELVVINYELVVVFLYIILLIFIWGFWLGIKFGGVIRYCRKCGVCI